MKIQLEKIKAMILYFAQYTDPRFLGKTKLMKLFYFADFGYVKKHGIPMTFDNYINMEHGPVPSTIYNLISTSFSDPEESFLSDIIEFKNANGISGMHKIIARKKFTDEMRKMFSISELQVLGEVSQRFYDSNKKMIEDASHKEYPWSSTKQLEEISYALATKDEDSETTEEEVLLALKILE